jgi:hypothetical protein
MCVSAMSEGAVKLMQQLLYKRLREKAVRIVGNILAQMVRIITGQAVGNCGRMAVESELLLFCAVNGMTYT